jgi:Cu/Ag efflux protein CusF
MRHVASIAILAALLVGSVQLIATAQDAAGGAGDSKRAPGGAMTVGATGTATVKAIDAEKRIVTLTTEDGDTVEIKCGPEVRNFDQIKVGDLVKSAAVAKLVLAVGKPASPGAGGAESSGVTIARAPKGSMPGAYIVRTEQVSAKVDAIDAEKQTATLSGLGDQPQEVKVAPDVDLSGVKVGDDVNITVTKGLALWVERPKDGAAAKPDADADKAELASFALVGTSATSTVSAIDPAKRLVTIKADSGATKVIHLGKECVNFDQIQVGDKVRTTVAEEVAVVVSKGDLPATGSGTMMALAPKGGKPGMLIAETEDLKANIKATDPEKKTITLCEADGACRTVKIAPGVKMDELKTGDDVNARITQAVAIVVEKP